MDFIPNISTAGQVFSTPDGEFDSLEVIITATSDKSKVYYAGEFVEGGSTPDCHSNDGVVPANDAEEPQAKKCAVCFQNQWGSKITDSGKKGKACTDFVRIVVFLPEALAKPLSLRVPASAVKNLDTYSKQIVSRGLLMQNVVTKIGFDVNAPYPMLTFNVLRFVEAKEQKRVDDAIEMNIEPMTYVLENAVSAFKKRVPFGKTTGFTS